MSTPLARLGTERVLSYKSHHLSLHDIFAANNELSS